MEYREFLENVRKEVESRYDSNVSVTLNHVMKNNGTELDGITIMEKDKNIAPTIYINSFYDRYREGVSLKAVVSEIIRIYNQNKNSIILMLIILKIMKMSEKQSYISLSIIRRIKNFWKMCHTKECLTLL